MKRIFNLIGQDITSALRDNILVYMIIAPLLLSFGARMLIPSVEDTGLSFAIEESIPMEIIEDLREYGGIEAFKSPEGVRSRVEKTDTVVGILQSNGKLTLLFEGNEPQELVDMYISVFNSITSDGSFVDVNHVSLGKRGSILKEMLTISMLMMALMIAGVISGFNIVADRESKAINAIAVSPLTTQSYIVARGILSNVIALIIAIGSSIILMAFDIDYSRLFLLLLLSAPLTILLGLIVGAFAQNQLTAIAIIKLLTPLYIGIPMISFFLPERLRYLFYWLPNYWQFQGLSNIYFSFPQSVSFVNASILTFVISSVFLLVFSRVVGKKLNLR